jgi:hypothetical protein
LEGLKLVHYLLMIALLAGMVMALRMVSTAGTRHKMLLLLGLYALLLSAVVISPTLRPEGLATDDLHRLIATMSVWIGIGLAIELSPVDEDSPIEGTPAEAGAPPPMDA